MTGPRFLPCVDLNRNPHDIGNNRSVYTRICIQFGDCLGERALAHQNEAGLSPIHLRKGARG